MTHISCVLRRAVAVAVLLVAVPLAVPLLAQEEGRHVVVLRDGREYIGTATIDTVLHEVIIRLRSGTRIVVPLDSVLTTSTLERTLAPPDRTLPRGGEPQWTCGRETPWYFVELRAVGLKEDNVRIGGEAAVGVRLGPFGLGIGGAIVPLDGRSRTPVFLHMRYRLGGECVKPFAFIDGGYVFDTFTSQYGIKPSVSRILNRSPKVAGIGVGLDFSVFPYFDLSIDGGYRYYTVANDRDMEACSGSTTVLGYTELHTAFLRIGVTL